MSPQPLSPRAAWALVLALFSALTAAMFAPLLKGHGWLVWDVPDPYCPDQLYLCESLRDGAWPRFMRAVRVGAGSQRVVMTYAPRGDRALRALALLSLLTCVALALRAGRAPRDPRG